MARLINGIMGAFRGKVGTVVGYTRNGEGIMRSLPRKISKNPSQKQLDNRKKMAACQAWLSFMTPFVSIGFKHYSKKQHGFGSALSYLKLNAVTENFNVDPEKALISWGDLPQPISPAVSNPESGVLEISWDAVRKIQTAHWCWLTTAPPFIRATFAAPRVVKGNLRWNVTI